MRIVALACVAFLVAALLLVPSVAGAAQSGPAAFFRQIERDLCRNIKSLKCKRKPARAAATKKPSPADAKVGEAKLDDAASTAGDIVLPKLRPDSLGTKVAAVVPQTPTAVVLPKLRVQNATPIVLPKLRPALAPPGKKPPAATKATVVIPPSAVVGKAKLANPEELDGSQCLRELKAANVSFEMASMSVSLGGCSVHVPVTVNGVAAGGGLIQFPDRPTLNCAFALRLSQWLKDSAQPLIAVSTGSTIAKFYTGPGYECRARNGDASQKISEHGFGNAIDIERVVLADKRQLWVKDATSLLSKSRAPLTQLRTSACGSFTTVLGPGSNTAHEEHFHLDLGRHGRSGTYVICQ